MRTLIESGVLKTLT